MSRTYATPLEVEINQSRSLIGLVLLISVIAALCIVLLPVHLVYKLLACIAIAALAYVEILKHNQSRQLIWDENNLWIIKSTSTDIRASLLADSYVSPWLTVLCFRTDANKNLIVIIFPDAIHPEQFRRLRGRLTIERSKLFSSIPDEH